MSAQHLAVALLFLGAVALGGAPYLGSPWPGVTLMGLSLLPWGLGAWLARGHSAAERFEALEPMMVKAAMSTEAAHERIGRMQEEISSLRSTVSLRGTLGG